MKLLTVCDLPKPYDTHCIVVIEEVFNDREKGTSTPYAKPYKIPVSGVKDVVVGSDVNKLFDQWGKLCALTKA